MKSLVIAIMICLISSLCYADKYTIELTPDEEVMLQACIDSTPFIQETKQEYVNGIVKNYLTKLLHETYTSKFRQKSLQEKKTLLSEVSISR